MIYSLCSVCLTTGQCLGRTVVFKIISIVFFVQTVFIVQGEKSKVKCMQEAVVESFNESLRLLDTSGSDFSFWLEHSRFTTHIEILNSVHCYRKSIPSFCFFIFWNIAFYFIFYNELEPCKNSF